MEKENTMESLSLLVEQCLVKKKGGLMYYQAMKTLTSNLCSLATGVTVNILKIGTLL